ncbi:MAG TPA: type II toxin-antitoxin system VapC family toxin [Terriglobia bacterium]|nr:type II toxin-antitoxin system VapC family toxin [Terriglobia bacterium]
MRILLDTQIWLWLCKSPERVSKRTLRQLENERNELLLSAASVWEIAIKYSLGKLPLPSPPAEYIPEGLTMTGTHPVAVQFSHAVRVARLPFHHRDPFDRLLIAQAQAEGIPIVTADPNFKRYDVEIISA